MSLLSRNRIKILMKRAWTVNLRIMKAQGVDFFSNIPECTEEYIINASDVEIRSAIVYWEDT